jgi:uncharacterized GH25 family protein
MPRNYATIICFAVPLILLCPAIIISSEQVRCTGRVVDTQGQPIAGAKVIAYEMHSDGIAGNIMLRQIGEIITTENGTFIFTTESKPTRGTFLDGYIVAARPELALGWAVWSMHENVEVSIELGKPEKLEGIIVDDAGKPVANAEVRVNLSGITGTTEGKQKDWLPGISPLEELGVQTDQQGRFSFNNIPADSGVDLLVTAPGKAIIYTYQLEKSEPAFKSGQTDLKVTLPDEARIEGKLIDPDTGKGIAGTKFAIVGSNLFYYRFVHTTNDDGTFSIGGLQTGQYLLRNGGFPSTYVDVESGKTTRLNVQADRLSRPRGISGIVRDPEGKPLPNTVITTCPQITEDTMTDINGAFTLKSTRVRTPNEEPIYLLIRNEERNLATADQFNESAKEFNITLDQGAILSGNVVDVNGNTIPNAKISLTFHTSSIGYVINDDVKIDKYGNYEIRAVPPGHTYSVDARAEGYGRRLSQITVSGTANERTELEPLVLSVANLSASGIVVDEFDQPVPEVTIFISGDGQPSRQTLTDVKGMFTIENICPGRINIYADKRTPRRLRGRAEAEADTKNIRIVVNELDERGRPIPKQPPSLVDKSLPDFNGIKIDLPKDQIKDKRLLVCFFDYQQRPSRNCILQLSKRAKELKTKDIVIIAVQASKTERATLDEWIKENDITIPIRMVEDDTEKIRFNWGVKSLPWLILTDRNHIVTAEGFSVSEMGEKTQ